MGSLTENRPFASYTKSRKLRNRDTGLYAGFIVAADDHVGHGKTAVVNDSWGDWGEKGAHTMMEDEHLLTLLVKEMYIAFI